MNSSLADLYLKTKYPFCTVPGASVCFQVRTTCVTVLHLVLVPEGINAGLFGLPIHMCLTPLGIVLYEAIYLLLCGAKCSPPKGPNQAERGPDLFPLTEPVFPCKKKKSDRAVFQK